MAKLILPDNNIFSEITRQQPDENVVAQFRANQQNLRLAITVWHELLYGIKNMAVGKKREQIASFIMNDVGALPMLFYTPECAEVHAQIRADCRKKGKTLGFADSQIASIALVNDAVLVTRNVDDFIDIDGLIIENWFDE